MSGQPKQKGVYPNDFKTKFGIGIQGLISVAGAALMSTMFMVYLTDYAGIGSWGATLATAVLFFGRIFDALNDPLEGWIIDNAKVTKTGKYKKFIIASVIITSVSLLMLYNMPDAILKSPVFVGIWVVFFYFAYDVGTSFNAFIPFTQSLTDDDEIRAKLFTISRIIGTIGAIPMGLLMTAALAFGDRLGGIKNAIGIMTLAAVIPVGLLSLWGILIVKEGKHIVEEEAESARFRDIFAMLRTNKAMGVHVASSLFSGFTWNIVAAVELYYIKWAYCADLATGIVDNEKLAAYTMIAGAAMVVPIFLITPFSSYVIKKTGSNVNAQKLSLALTLIPSVVMYILQLFGVLQGSFALMFVLVLLIACAMGIGFVPATAMWAECIEYNRFKTGKEMGGLVSAIRSLLEKGQGAVAGALVGILLIFIGYNVDSNTGSYLGELSRMPSLLNNFVLLMGIIPAGLSVIAILIYRAYPITPELKKEMKEQFESRLSGRDAEPATAD